ncbi:MAG: hypothetical protein ACI8RO_001757 [Flavobacteriales bacterium]
MIKLIGISFLFTGEGMSYASQWVYADSSKIETGLNLKFTCREETLAEVIRWLHKCANLSASQIGTLAPSPE